MFQSEFLATEKESDFGSSSCVSLGRARWTHRFYLGQVVLGIFYLVFCWTFVPLIASLIETFLIRKRVEEYNKNIGLEIAIKIRAVRS